MTGKTDKYEPGFHCNGRFITINFTEGFCICFAPVLKGVLLLLMFISIFGYAQNNQKNPITDEINLPADTNSIIKLLSDSDEFRLSNLDSAIECASKAVELSEKINNVAYLAKSSFELAKGYQLVGDNKKALRFFLSALNHYKSENKVSGIAATYNEICWQYYVLANYELALEYAQKPLEMGDDLATPNSYNNSYQDNLISTY